MEHQDGDRGGNKAQEGAVRRAERLHAAPLAARSDPRRQAVRQANPATGSAATNTQIAAACAAGSEKPWAKPSRLATAADMAAPAAAPVQAHRRDPRAADGALVVGEAAEDPLADEGPGQAEARPHDTARDHHPDECAVIEHQGAQRKPRKHRCDAQTDPAGSAMLR